MIEKIRIPEQMPYNGRTLQRISSQEAKEMKLKSVGSASAESLCHAIYLMDKFCRDRKKVKFYSVEWVAANVYTRECRGLLNSG